MKKKTATKRAAKKPPLIDDGILSEVPEGERKTSKASDRYVLNCQYVPERVEKAPERAVSKKQMAGWVFKAAKIWLDHKGVVSPADVEKVLRAAVQLKGEAGVLTALENYARKADGRFASLKRFAATLEDWMPSANAGTGNRSFSEEW